MNLRHTRNRIFFPLLALALSGLAPGNAALADLTTTYVVDVNTTGISGQSGYLDFQFNPNNASALPATANVSGFHTDATGISMVYSTGDVSGTTTTGLAFDNGHSTNEWTDQLTFGTYASFDATVSASATGGSGSAFYLSLLDSKGNYYSTGPATVTIALKPDGSTTGIAYSPANGVSPTATVMSVPEPSTTLLWAIAIATLIGCDRLRHRASV